MERIIAKAEDKPELEKEIYFICPVRGMTKQDKQFIEEYVARTEAGGRGIYSPPRDTKQDDPIELNICMQNRKGTADAKETHMYFSSTSQGNVFDPGMAFMADKPLLVLNPESLNGNIEGVMADFAGFVNNYAYNTPMDKALSFYQELERRKKEISKMKMVEFEWEANDAPFLFDCGMAFMAEKLIKLSNWKNVEPTDHKSFQNILLSLYYKARDGKTKKVTELF